MYPRKNNGQASVDYLVSLGVGLILMVSLVYAATNQSRLATDVIARSEAKGLAGLIASEIDDVVLAGDNSTKTLTIPYELKVIGDYDVIVYPKSVVVRYERDGVRIISHNTISKEVNHSSQMILPKGEVLIKNQGGVVYLEGTD